MSYVRSGWTAGLMCVVLTVAAGAASAQAPARLIPPAPIPTNKQEAKTRLFLAQCRQEFKKVDAQIDRAGTRFAGYRQVPGFPYMRSDRLLASYGDQIDHPATTGAFDASSEAFDAWTLELRDNDGFSREIELENMGMGPKERVPLLTQLRLCAVWLSNIELTDPATLHKLVMATQVPGSKAPKNPALVARLDRETAKRQAEITADFARPVAQLDSPGPLVLWRVKKTADDSDFPKDFSQLQHDGLGRVGMTMDTWRALAERNAPGWLIESGGPYDVIGAPQWTKTGVSLDPQRPYIYYQPTYARINGRAVIQIDYFVWFSERPAMAKHDPEAGHLDGLIWRVTLDSQGKPLLYDAIHMTGFDQMWFTPRTMLPRPQADGHPAQLLIPQQVDLAAGTPTVRLHSGTHTPRRLLTAGQVPAVAAKPYELHEYEELMTMEVAGGRSRNLFNTSGVIQGTQRGDGQLYRQVPVPQAGALRQWGLHPTTLAARDYFDDPYLIDKLFTISGRSNSASLTPTRPKAADTQVASAPR